MSLTKSEMMRRVAGGRGIESFHHQELGIFNITMIRTLVKKMKDEGAKPHRCDFADLRTADPEATRGQTVLEWLTSQREVDMDRVAELSPSQVNEPVIHAVDADGAHYPIDGIHRLVRRARDGATFFRYWAIPLAQCPMIKPDDYHDVPWGKMEVTPTGLQPRDQVRGTVTGTHHGPDAPDPRLTTEGEIACQPTDQSSERPQWSPPSPTPTRS